jgi:hypothetical protein
MKKTLFVALFAMAAASASAAPIITADVADLGGGLLSYTVYVDDDANASASYFLDNLAFTGKILQDKAGGKNTVIVDTEDDADNWDGINYDKLADSWFTAPWTDNTVAPGFVDSLAGAAGLLDRTYAITAGSGGGSTLDKVQVAYIVAEGPISYAGLIGRQGANFGVQGVLAIPEPSTAILLGLGGLAMIGIARRRSRTGR